MDRHRWGAGSTAGMGSIPSSRSFNAVRSKLGSPRRGIAAQAALGRRATRRFVSPYPAALHCSSIEARMGRDDPRC